MRKMFLITALLILTLILPIDVSSNEVKVEEEELILALLESHINEAVNKYYGRLITFDLNQVEIKEVKRGNCEFCFAVNVDVRTNQELNSMSLVESITFTISNGKVVTTDYNQRKES